MDSLQLQAEMPALLALVIEAMKTHPSAPEAGWAGDGGKGMASLRAKIRKS